MGGVDVLWSVVQGDGDLLGDRIQIEGQPGEATVSTTDSDGLAEMKVIARSNGTLEIEARTLFAESPVSFQVSVTR